MNTLLLTLPGPDPIADPGWDLCLDAHGNIALAPNVRYAEAQDVASAVRTFRGEAWYDTTLGVPYFQQILGQLPSLQFMKAQFVAAAMTVPNIASVACFLTGPGPDRAVGGQLQIVDVDGYPVPVVSSPQLGVAPWYVSAVSTDDPYDDNA